MFRIEIPSETAARILTGELAGYMLIAENDNPPTVLARIESLNPTENGNSILGCTIACVDISDISDDKKILLNRFIKVSTSSIESETIRPADDVLRDANDALILAINLFNNSPVIMKRDFNI